MNYGIPYQGSKNKIISSICAIFPSAENFYDLFGGGFSVTHFMIRHRPKDFKRFHFNEIRPGVTDLIKDAISGKYSYDVFRPAWISRERFFAEKESNAYIKIIWSFGNNGKSYIFGKEREYEVRSLHNAIVSNVFDQYSKEILGLDKFRNGQSIKDRRMFLKNRLVVLKGKRNDLQRLQQLEQLERLQGLQGLQQLSFYSGDYRAVNIANNSVIYCDIPYYGTVEYDKNKNFNHKDFFDWAAKIEQPLFISEYMIKDDRFKLIWSEKVRTTFSSTSNNDRKIERVYGNKAAVDSCAMFRKKFLI